MKIRFWGVRGSIASPISGAAIQAKIRAVLEYASPADVLDERSIDRFLRSLPFSLRETYGGNTTCLEVRSAADDLVIVDAGTGIRNLGAKMLGEGYMEGKGECALLFTHTHWDHIQGLPFFVPFYIPDNKFHIHAVSDDIRERLVYQHNPRQFPIEFEGMKAQKTYTQHDEKDVWELYGMRVSHKAMRHPSGSYSFCFEQDGKKFVFCTDAEFTGEDMDDIEEYLAYFKDADILVFDTQYTFDEQLQRIDWGHSSASIATDIAMKAGVKNLVLFHHDPYYDDQKLDEVYLRALRYQEMMDIRGTSSMKIVMAYEGLLMEI